MKTILLGFCCFFLLAVPCLADISDDLAIASAHTFATNIDGGNLQAAYWSGAPLLRLADDAQVWIDRIARTQLVLGKVVERNLTRIRTVTSPPGLPDDDYRIILFAARTEHKAAAAEVILLHQVTGLWQVCSYMIR